MLEREVVSFKGTRQGILMSIIENEPFAVAIDELEKKMKENKSFFSGSPVSLDLGWRELEPEDLEELLDYFEENEMKLMGIISSSLNTRRICENRGIKVIIGRLGLADHHGNPRKKAKKPPKTFENDNTPEFDTIERRTAYPTREMEMPQETLMVKKTVRSGQTVVHPGNLVIIGDVNPGAEVRAGGDLVIVGALRGVAHAGFRSVFKKPTLTALKFKPTQIKIGDVLVNKFEGKVARAKQPVTAKLKNGKIEFKIY